MPNVPQSAVRAPPAVDGFGALTGPFYVRAFSAAGRMELAFGTISPFASKLTSDRKICRWPMRWLGMLAATRTLSSMITQRVDDHCEGWRLPAAGLRTGA